MEHAGRLLGKLKSKATDPEMRACAAWKIAAGKFAGKHTRATALVRGKLIVEVGDQVWQNQLAALRGSLLKNLAELLEEPVVTDIDFRPMPKRIEPQRAERAIGREDVEDPVLGWLYRQSRKRG